ncbi:hypothetical protein IV203_019607 [Nitzschia inconspicua]|uniref:Ion transport domain-containing protein n=1 Tax=Nitzschia inconspicua TaxID=303405 RepID=A0A9K3Q4F9_9STRA|nr:hypothetical protein IV203_019607 [Nitzschia inconspicua]
MCSLSQASSPARTKTKAFSILRGDMTQQQYSYHEETEQRDDIPIFGLSSSSNCSTHVPMSINSLSIASEQSRMSITASIPFAKTFSVAESCRQKASLISPSEVSKTSPFYTPPRRRARSSEGGMIRNQQRKDDEHEKDTSKSASEWHVEVSTSSLSPQHFFSPLSPLANDNSVKQTQMRQRKQYGMNAQSLSVAKPSIPFNSVKWQRHRPKHGTARKKKKYVIPLEHPFKIIWDALTVFLSIAHGYLTHVAIRDRQFRVSPFIAFCDAWFLVDILLNFVTERKTNTGEVLSDHRSIIARYLTSWFAVDALSLFPWEALYIQPLIEIQNRRGILKKSFFRSKAVVRVTRHLRGRHFRWFGTVAKHTKHHGVGAQRLLRLIIKYIPKYWMFLRNMKGVVAIRFFRFVHWLRRSIMNFRFRGTATATDRIPKSSNSNASTKSETTHEDDEDMMMSDLDDDDGVDLLRNKSVEVVYEDFRMLMQADEDDDDDGVPL